MFVGNRYPPRDVWFWARKNIFHALCISTTVYVGYEWLQWKLLSIPFLPVSTIGTAVAFYLGFKNNSSYDRLWEGRRIWGSITNVSRTWAALVLSVVEARGNTAYGMKAATAVSAVSAVNSDTEAARDVVKQLIYRQIAWVNALRIQLRQQPGIHRRDPDDFLHIATVRRLQAEQGDEENMDALLERLSCQLEGAHGQPGNVASALLRQQADQIAQLKRQGWIDA
ncbi:MAG: bestrophin family ion channel, partial [Armatimonadota bacterium]